VNYPFNEDLTAQLDVLKTITLFSFMDIAIFDITLVTVAMGTGKGIQARLNFHTDCIRDAIVSCCLNSKHFKTHTYK